MWTLKRQLKSSMLRTVAVLATSDTADTYIQNGP